jgi:hypothetical protein
MACSIALLVDTIICYHSSMKRKHQRTLELIFARPVSANVRWADIEVLFVELGGQVTEREGSRVLVRLFGDRRVFIGRTPNRPRTRGRSRPSASGWNDHGVKP